MLRESFPPLVLTIMLALAMVAGAQIPGAREIPTLDYGELMQKPETYLEKEVRVKAFWTYGFEWSFLCDAECADRATRAWVEFIDEDDLCRGSKGKLKKGRKDSDKVETVLVGKLSGGGRYGHMNAYRYRFTVSCVEKLKKSKVEIK